MAKKKKNLGYKYQGTGLTYKEKRNGAIRFEDYCENYPHLHKMSDLLLLEELIFQEMLHDRIKEQISKVTELKEKSKGQSEVKVPSTLQNALKDSLDVQFKLKEKLGLFEDKMKLDAFRDFENLKEDFREYRRRNPNIFKTTCPSCSFIYFLKRRTDCYEELEAPWFKDKILCNPELWDAYKCGEINKKRIANILGTSEDYIDWLGEKIFVDKENSSLSDEISLETFSTDDSSKNNQKNI